MPDRMLVVAATNTLARGYFAVPTDRMSLAGEPVNALFAVTRGIAKAMTFKLPARAVAVIEAGAPPATWPELLKKQLPGLAPLLRATGLHVVEAADELHVVAAYVQAAVDAGDDVVVVGMDKRLAQLVSDRVWWYDANKDARYTPEMVFKRFAVPPPKVAEWLALVGNPDDGLPGIAGIGAKGATGLLDTYGSVAGAFAAIDAITGRPGNALRAARDQVPAEVARATLDRTRALPVPLAELAFVPPPAGPLNAAYRELGFLEYLAADGGDRVAVTICDTPEAIGAALAAFTGAVAIHAVTEDPTPIHGRLVGMSLASGDRKAVYIPIGEVIDLALVAWLEDPAIAKLGHDTKAAVVALRQRGIELAKITGDSMCASHLTQPSNWAPHDLAIVAKLVLGRALSSEDAARGVGAKRKAWGAMEPHQVGDFAGHHADASAAVWAKLSPDIDRTLHAEYLALSEVLVRMELRGIGVDAGELVRAEEAFIPLEAELEREITALAGKSFNLNSSKQLGSVLFEDLKLPIVSHTKTGWSTATEALERIEHAHPIVALVIRWRLLRRLR
ncbi:MAG: DNA polymerase, partial [Kofleriaceae bacterium]